MLILGWSFLLVVCLGLVFFEISCFKEHEKHDQLLKDFVRFLNENDRP
jgi:hypothetical protein